MSVNKEKGHFSILVSIIIKQKTQSSIKEKTVKSSVFSMSEISNKTREAAESSQSEKVTQKAVNQTTRQPLSFGKSAPDLLQEAHSKKNLIKDTGKDMGNASNFKSNPSLQLPESSTPESLKTVLSNARSDALSPSYNRIKSQSMSIASASTSTQSVNDGMCGSLTIYFIYI